jgi:uncharacterized membrane protein SirB2
MEFWKLIHVVCAFLSISGFVLRGFWMLSDSPWFSHRLTKILPHTIDSLLLFSAIAILYVTEINPIDHHWLLAKIFALFLYIIFGLMAFRFGKTKQQRVVAWVMALFAVAYIVQTAFTKNIFIF